MGEKCLITKSTMTGIGNAIRGRNGSQTSYKPGQMAAAITTIPNSYSVGDEGKVVSSGALVSQSDHADVTPTASDQTIDTTTNNSIKVKGDVNLVAGNIKSGVNIFGVTGSYSGGGGGGGGGGDVTLLTADQWAALTTAQKQSYGLVAIQEASTGYLRGKLVNGADYVPIGLYLPESDESKIICEAYTSIFDASALSWGNGSSPITIQDGLNPTLSQEEAAVYLPISTNGKFAYVDLGGASIPFTAYVVMRANNPGTYSRMIAAFNTRSAGHGIMIYGSNLSVSSWANDTATGVSASSYFAAAIQFAVSSSAFGLVEGGSVITKSPTDAGRYVTLGRTDINQNTANAEPCNIYVRYMAVVKEAESQATVQANLASLYAEFIGS